MLLCLVLVTLACGNAGKGMLGAEFPQVFAACYHVRLFQAEFPAAAVQTFRLGEVVRVEADACVPQALAESTRRQARTVPNVVRQTTTFTVDWGRIRRGRIRR